MAYDKGGSTAGDVPAVHEGPGVGVVEIKISRGVVQGEPDQPDGMVTEEIVLIDPRSCLSLGNLQSVRSS